MVTVKNSLVRVQRSCIIKIFTWSLTVSYLDEPGFQDEVLPSPLLCGLLYLPIWSGCTTLCYLVVPTASPVASCGLFLLRNHKFWMKFNAIVLFKIFCHISKKNLTALIKIWLRSLTLPLSSAVCQRLDASAGRKKFKHAH